MQKPQRRGAEVFAYQLSEALGQRGLQTRIVYLYPHEGDASFPLRSGDSLLDGSEHHPFERILGVHPRLLVKLRRAISDFRPDVVQVNGSRTVKYGALAHRRRQSRRALIYRNIGDPGHWVQGSLRRLVYRHVVASRFDGIVGVSRTTLDSVRKFYRLSVPMRHIPRGVSIVGAKVPVEQAEVKRRLATPDQAPVVLHLGSLSPEKRVERAVHLLHDLRDEFPSLHLWLVGDGPCRGQLEKLSGELEVLNRVRFAGARSDVGSFIGAADLLLLTSDTEGIPGAVLEAGARAVPSVATRVGGVPECVHDGETGLLVEPEDDAGRASAVAQILRDSERRISMGKAAQRWIADRFSLDRIADQYIAFYVEVLESLRDRAA